MNDITFLQTELAAHQTVLKELNQLLPQIGAVAQCMRDCLKNGGKILSCGNGGSAGDSQHFAAELVGRFERERAELAAIANKFIFNNSCRSNI